MTHEGTHERGPNKGPVSNKPWSEVDKSKLPAGCHAYAGDSDRKATWALPHHEGAGGIDPDTGMYRRVGPLNRAGVHNAAARFNQVKWGQKTADTSDSPEEAKNKAKRHLRAAYRYMDEDPPPVLQDTISFLSAEIGLAKPAESQVAELLEEVNRRFARESLAAEQVFFFPAQYSNQRLDDYGTRQTAETLQNYLALINTAGVPLMDSHRTPHRSFFSSAEGELPIGLIFSAGIQGKPITFKRGQDFSAGQRLTAWAYMLRDSNVTGRVNTDDYIANIQAGILRALSIGFRPEWLRCSLCGKNYLNRDECQHIVFKTYEASTDDDFQPGICFVWVENGELVEGSLVYAGACPEAMIEKARAAAPDLTPGHIDLLEHKYHARIAPRATFIMPEITLEGPTDLLGSDATKITAPEGGLDAGEPVLHGSPGWSGPPLESFALEILGGEDNAIRPASLEIEGQDDVEQILMSVSGDFIKALADEIEPMSRSLAEVLHRQAEHYPDQEMVPLSVLVADACAAVLQDQVRMPASKVEKEPLYARIREKDAQLEAQAREMRALERRLAENAPFVELGHEYVNSLVERALAARTKAQGQAFDRKAYEDALRKGGIEFVKAEIAAHERHAKTLFRPGRPTRPKTSVPVRDARLPRSVVNLYRVG